MKTTTTMSSSSYSTVSIPTQSSNYEDEMFMNKNLLFSDSVKDLRNLRSQLYSAAEYFEAAYPNDKQKPILVSNLKEYTIKALVNTLDHLGALTHRVNLLVDEKADEVSATQLRVSCIEQRLRTCQAYIDHEGFAQQSLAIATPKHHKRYILPVGESVRSAGHTISAYQGCSSLGDDENWVVRGTIKTHVPSSIGKGRSPSPTLLSMQHGQFSFRDKQKVSDKEPDSPRSKFPLLRSGSTSGRSSPGILSRSTTTKPPSGNTSKRAQYPSEPLKSFITRADTDNQKASADKDNQRDTEQHQSKSKSILKNLLSRRKSKKSDLYTFLDEY